YPPSSPTPYSQPYVAGVAYGSYARTLVSPILDNLEKFHEEHIQANLAWHQNQSLGYLETYPDMLWQAVEMAHSLVSQLKPSRPIAAIEDQLNSNS
ncbi:hypothetical protein IQ258_29800, partial [Coleofasciculus sp. LEGE 07081]|uniref:Light dependent period protein LdpA domain-containing protein n=1 Tax=Coleofasciculus sp. LEGE 07081 TaxID=2777967 RepID=UPI0019EFFE4C